MSSRDVGVGSAGELGVEDELAFELGQAVRGGIDDVGDGL
jgi:hypothetical protein